MNRGSVQHEGVLPSWRTILVLQAGDVERLRPVPLGYQIVPVGSRTTVLAVVRFFSNETGLLQVLDRTLDRGTGERELPGDCVQARPGDVVLILAVVEIQIDQLSSVWQVHAIQKVQSSH